MTVWSWQGYYATRERPVSTDAVMAAIPLVRAARDAGESYGACHLVLADINLEREHVQFCRDQPNITAEGAAAMDALLAMTMRERAITLCIAKGEEFHAWSEEEWAQFDRDEDDDEVDQSDELTKALMDARTERVAKAICAEMHGGDECKNCRNARFRYNPDTREDEWDAGLPEGCLGLGYERLAKIALIAADAEPT